MLMIVLAGLFAALADRRSLGRFRILQAPDSLKVRAVDGAIG